MTTSEPLPGDSAHGASEREASKPGGGGTRSRSTRTRSWLSTACAVLAALTLTAGVLSTWVERTLFDSAAFADRAVALLDSKAVRADLAGEIADELIANGSPQLVAFRSVLIDVIDDAIGTDGFKKIFHEAVMRAHHAVFTDDGSQALLQLGEGASIFTTTLQVAYPDVATKLPSDLDSTVVDVTRQIRGLELWQTLQDLSWLNEALMTAGVALAVVVIAVDPNRRMGVVKVGVAVVFAGAFVFGISAAAPRFAATFVTDPALASAVSSAVRVFVADLTSLGLWLVLIGVITAAGASAVAPEHEPVGLTELFTRAKSTFDSWQPASNASTVVKGLILVAVGGALIVTRDAVVPFAMVLVGAYVAYRGVLVVLHVVGRPRGRSLLPESDAYGPHRAHHRRRVAVAIVAAVAVALTSVTAGASVLNNRNRARVAADLQCNLHSELCDRRLDQVTFAGAHNAQSAATYPGWLFAEQSTGITSQLELGVRALLLKSHYGFATGVRVGGAEIVVTDTAKELEANRTGAEDELTPDQLAKVRELAASAPQPSGPPEVFLCHVACELGALRFTDALYEVKAFLGRNPNEVVILFIGDFVSADDTIAAFQQVGLADRLWQGDASATGTDLPTLRDLIDAGTNILLFSEHSGQPPAWNNAGYGMWQDTPFTFPTPSDFSCAKNRGPATAPLFQINHWLTTTSPPDPRLAAQVNAYDVLMPAVQQCQQQRGMMPNLVGVNFVTQGDLMRVVDELNGVS